MKIEQIGDYLTYIEKCTFDELLDLSNKNDFTDDSFLNMENQVGGLLLNKQRNTSFVVRHHRSLKDYFDVVKVITGPEFPELTDLYSLSAIVMQIFGPCYAEVREKSVIIDFERFWKFTKVILQLERCTEDEINFVKSVMTDASYKNKKNVELDDFSKASFKNGKVKIKGELVELYAFV